MAKPDDEADAFEAAAGFGHAAGCVEEDDDDVEAAAGFGHAAGCVAEDDDDEADDVEAGAGFGHAADCVKKNRGTSGSASQSTTVAVLACQGKDVAMGLRSELRLGTRPHVGIPSKYTSGWRVVNCRCWGGGGGG